MAILADGEQAVVALQAHQILTVISATGTGTVARNSEPAKIIREWEMFMAGPFDQAASYSIIGPAKYAVRTVR